MNKFKKEETDPFITPIEWFNFYGDFKIIFEGDKKCISYSDYNATYFTEGEVQSKTPTFELNKFNLVEVKKSNPYDFPTGKLISKFMLLSAVKFKRDNYKAISFIMFSIMKKEIPYIRVGVDYFKIINKNNRYDINQVVLKPWDKTTITEDHGKTIIPLIYRFDDFTIIPNNKEFIPTQSNCFNLYSKFQHIPYNDDVSFDDIPITIGLIKHIFGEQFELGLKYMKLLYEYPWQILPVLALVSNERQTGKTTFLNYIQMLFGENSTLINPSDLMSNYNDSYATKNIIMIDETVIDKSHTIEKLKSIATAKTMSVSQKFVQHYSVPFYGKVIICTNKETDFMKIDDEEIRFWVRKIKPIIGKRNTKIEEQLRDEIPKFLKLLADLPEIDFSKSRMVFTEDEIKTDSLIVIKEESKSSIRKEIEIYIEDFFNNNNTLDSFEATSKDIKERWFDKNNQISINYIFKILKTEMKLEPQKMKKYYPFNEITLNSKSGTPFLFRNKNYQITENQQIKYYDEDLPF